MTTDPVICSAKGCREPATFRLIWNNPKLHTPDREKVWAACAEHREPLSHHLSMRSFLRRVDPLDDQSVPGSNGSSGETGTVRDSTP